MNMEIDFDTHKYWLTEIFQTLRIEWDWNPRHLACRVISIELWIMLIHRLGAINP